jgi:hypothetical protein
MSRHYIDTTELTRVMDDDLGVMDFLSITKEDISSRGKLRPIGARHYAMRAQLLQNILGVFNSPIGAIIQPHISGKRIAQMVEEYMGFEKYDFIGEYVGLFEQGEQQKIVQQVQKELQQDAAAPSMDDRMLQEQGRELGMDEEELSPLPSGTPEELPQEGPPM